jgi:hypothetical protein
MFCDRCGQAISDEAQFCAGCGKRQGYVPPAPAAPLPRGGRVSRNLHILGVLWIVIGALRLIEMAWILHAGHTFLPALAGGFGSDAYPFSGRFPVESIVWSGLAFAGFWIGLFGAIEVVIGWGLMERQPWARIFGLVVGFLLLIRFPLGTALGIYTIWVLLPAPSGQEYDRLTHTS